MSSKQVKDVHEAPYLTLCRASALWASERLLRY
jgi:hypothetical protein